MKNHIRDLEVCEQLVDQCLDDETYEYLRSGGVVNF